MPRHRRVQLGGYPFHVIQRGNNRTACFFCAADNEFYLEHLKRLTWKHGVAVHAYVLMTNHVHLLLTPRKADGIAAVMARLGQRYVRYVNETYRRTGTLWEGRYRSSVVDADDYLLACQVYIETNPVRAGMVEHPAEYAWSSYRANAQGERDALLTPHALYVALATTPAQRQAEYRQWFRHELEPGLVDEIRNVTNGGFALGSERFRAQVAYMLGRRVDPGKAGRPKRAGPDARQAGLVLEPGV